MLAVEEGKCEMPRWTAAIVAILTVVLSSLGGMIVGALVGNSIAPVQRSTLPETPITDSCSLRGVARRSRGVLFRDLGRDEHRGQRRGEACCPGGLMAALLGLPGRIDLERPGDDR